MRKCQLCKNLHNFPVRSGAKELKKGFTRSHDFQWRVLLRCECFSRCFPTLNLAKLKEKTDNTEMVFRKLQINSNIFLRKKKKLKAAQVTHEVQK